MVPMRGVATRGLIVMVGVAWVWLGALGVDEGEAAPGVEVLGVVDESAFRSASLPVIDGTATTSTSSSIPATVVSTSQVFPITEPLPDLVGSEEVSTTTSTPDPRSDLEVGEAALAAIRFDWRSSFPEWSVDFLPGRSGLRALTYPNERRVEIYVRDSDTLDSLRRVIAHELGHVVDVELNSGADRERWILERGLGPSVDWWPSPSSPDFGTGAGDFAEAFAVWETGIRSQSTVAGQPDSDDLRLLEELSTG